LSSARPRWASLVGSQVAEVLSLPALAKTAHFSLSHRPAGPVLSTVDAPIDGQIVDKTASRPIWTLGLVVPKRHARRSVTRQLIRRQMRAAVARRPLAAGDWLLRLRSGFDVRRYPSAASDALRVAVRSEIEQLFERVPA
jgi:ribonuclease P protein component